MDTELANTVAVVGIIAALVQQCKRVPALTNMQTHLPIFVVISMVLGIGGAYYISSPNAILRGLMMGLTACGAYSASKIKTHDPPPTEESRPTETLP